LAYKKSQKVAAVKAFAPLGEKAQASAVECGMAKEFVVYKLHNHGLHMLYVKKNDGKALSEDSLKCFAKVATIERYNVGFEDERIGANFEKLLREAYYEKNIETAYRYIKQAKLIGKFETYDPAKRSLGAYGRYVERFCGVQPGSALTLVGDRLLAPLSGDLYSIDENLPVGEAGCVWSILQLAELRKHGASYGKPSPN
jgi:hypothetical protein